MNDRGIRLGKRSHSRTETREEVVGHKRRNGQGRSHRRRMWVHHAGSREAHQDDKA